MPNQLLTFVGFGSDDRCENRPDPRSLEQLSRMNDRTNFFVGRGPLALINAGLAQGKGRSGLIWCLLSLLLGPIATFLIVVLDRVPAQLD